MKKKKTPPPPKAAALSLTTGMDEPVSLEEQVACARRELTYRRSYYQTLVGAKRMTVFKANDEIRAMAAIVKTLEGKGSV